MYIIKNALRCIARSKARNILIGVIVLVIAVSSCIGLSIRQAAESAKKDALESMKITASISFDRSAAMKNMADNNGEPPEKPDGEGSGEDMPDRGFDRDSFRNMMEQASSLSLDEYIKYANAEAVDDYYYSLTVYADGGDGFEPVSTDSEDTDTENSENALEVTPNPPENPNGNGNFGNMPDGSQGQMPNGEMRHEIFGSNSDFTVIGFSGESAMSAFIDGSASVTSGSIFTEGTSDYECIISEELAAFNYISVGDTIKISNPNNEDELYALTVKGFYTDSSANENSFSMFGSTSNDPANRIYMSSNALQSIVNSSETAVLESTDDGAQALRGSLDFTYLFADIEDYESFKEQVRALGLDESYTVFSADVSAFETSLTPLNTLSTMAGYFLIVILLIGAVILIVLNIFNVRERKYEIGVLTAMGMKKGKVALQFLTEIFVVTLAAVIIGAGIGAVSTVPVTNALLKNQAASQDSQTQRIEENFGRGGESFGAVGGAPDKGDMRGGRENMFGNMFNSPVEFITEINSAMNFTVVLQMLGIGILLTLAAGLASMLFVMRYEPLKILANRD